MDSVSQCGFLSSRCSRQSERGKGFIHLAKTNKQTEQPGVVATAININININIGINNNININNNNNIKSQTSLESKVIDSNSSIGMVYRAEHLVRHVRSHTKEKPFKTVSYDRNIRALYSYVGDRARS
ncbi:hypothetical protein LZ554_006719 [Drepanopeziza brunnea f. sp. 'monogermtubi']|nr:hypothetical protein LZ554_006719 [Drepanopeziza brunnea f. sp. 'monogermtubi']